MPHSGPRGGSLGAPQSPRARTCGGDKEKVGGGRELGERGGGGGVSTAQRGCHYHGALESTTTREPAGISSGAPPPCAVLVGALRVAERLEVELKVKRHRAADLLQSPPEVLLKPLEVDREDFRRPAVSRQARKCRQGLCWLLPAKGGFERGPGPVPVDEVTLVRLPLEIMLFQPPPASRRARAFRHRLLCLPGRGRRGLIALLVLALIAVVRVVAARPPDVLRAVGVGPAFVSLLASAEAAAASSSSSSSSSPLPLAVLGASSPSALGLPSPPVAPSSGM